MTTYTLKQSNTRPEFHEGLPSVKGFASLDEAIDHLRESGPPEGIQATVLEVDDDDTPVHWYGINMGTLKVEGNGRVGG